MKSSRPSMIKQSRNNTMV